MAYVPNRDDPFLTPRPPRPDELRRDENLERELQADPELVEGPSSPGRVAAYAIGILLLLGAVFYGLNAANNSSPTASNPASPNANVAQSSPTNAPPPGPPVRNVTPGPNMTPGTTTGSAPSPAPATGSSSQ
jgi:hypothetical protein